MVYLLGGCSRFETKETCLILMGCGLLSSSHNMSNSTLLLVSSASVSSCKVTSNLVPPETLGNVLIQVFFISYVHSKHRFLEVHVHQILLEDYAESSCKASLAHPPSVGQARKPVLNSPTPLLMDDKSSIKKTWVTFC